MYNEFECEKVITALKISHIFNGRNNAKVCIFKRAENPHPQITELTPPTPFAGIKSGAVPMLNQATAPIKY